MTEDHFLKKLSQLNINPSKQQEILKNTKIKTILSFLFNHFEPNKLFYIIATKIPNNLNNEENLYKIGKLINENIITHERSLQCAIENINNEHLEKFILSFQKSNEEIENIITNFYKPGMEKKELMKIIANCEDLKYANTSNINKAIDIFLSKNKTEVVREHKIEDNRFAWIKEGELSKIHMPETNPLNEKSILEEHLKRTNGRVITRFPPEPNGYLHIGHAKALNLSYDFCKLHNGEFILRFDDTNPKNEKQEYAEQIQKDVKWLLTPENGNNEFESNNNKQFFDTNNVDSKIQSREDINPFTKITYASDYYDKFIEFGFFLINKEKAYACNQNQEEMKEYRKLNLDSPFRNRSKELNLILFQEMIDGKWKEGTISLRLKMDMKSKNPLMHDLVAFRVIECEHYRTKNKFKVYPSYDFTHCINDSLEDITHSFCSREFFNRKETYYWLLEELNLYKPVQWEFSRLNIEDTMLSKRKIIDLIEKKIVQGWDDPRLFTLCALRRRGFTPDGINTFIKSLGITFNESVIELQVLENFIREDLLKKAKKINCVVEPLKLKIKNTNEFVYIEKSDFKEEDSEDFLRLTKTQSVGLFNYITIKYVKKENDYILVEEVKEKPKKYIHYVKDYVTVELRLYDRLFINGEFNEKSLIVKQGYCQKEILNFKEFDKLQFMRVGFFCVDKDSSKENIILNLTLPLKNPTWK